MRTHGVNIGYFFMQTEIKFEEEIWKDVIGYEGIYKVSNLGRVKSIERTKQNYSKRQFVPSCFLKPYISVGYYKVDLSKNRKRKRYFIHRLLGDHFIPNPENKKTINHKNGIKTDYRLENLEWATQSEQMKHALETGLRIITAKKIIQMDMNGVFIKEWKSTKIG